MNETRLPLRPCRCSVGHRDYAITGSKVLLEVFDRRVDVTSPGALPNHMTAERVRAGADHRQSDTRFPAPAGMDPQAAAGVYLREAASFAEWT